MENILDLLFTENSSGLPEVNTEYKLFNSVQTIISRDIGRTKDGVKEQARKELAYVYFHVKKDAFEGYSAEDREKIIRERIGMHGKWKPDNVVLQAIEDLKEDTVTTQDRLIISAKQNLEDFLTLFEEVGVHTRTLIELLKTDKTTIKNSGEREEAITRAKAYFKEATSNIKDIKICFELVDQLELSRKTTKAKQSRKQYSKLETDTEIYKREV